MGCGRGLRLGCRVGGMVWDMVRDMVEELQSFFVVKQSTGRDVTMLCQGSSDEIAIVHARMEGIACVMLSRICMWLSDCG